MAEIAPISDKPGFEKSSDGGEVGPVGAYLVYEPTSGGRLMIHYSTGPVPDNAVGFWCPGPHDVIQGFKFKQAGGRQELIKGIAGGDANRRKYFGGWCQFLKLAKAKNGRVIQFEQHQSVPVDVYAYLAAKNQPVMLDLDNGLVDIGLYDAVAVMPKHHNFMKGVQTIQLQNFLEKGNLAGASTLMK